MVTKLQQASGMSLTEADEMIKRLLSLPRKILNNHGLHGLSSIILHEIAPHLDLQRAGFFVDNHDFNCLRGIAGFCNQECHLYHPSMAAGEEQLPEKPEFHQRISQLAHPSICDGQGVVREDGLRQLMSDCELHDAHAHVWNMRHGNTGIFVYQEGPACLCSAHPEILEHITSLLSFCPLDY